MSSDYHTLLYKDIAQSPAVALLLQTFKDMILDEISSKSREYETAGVIAAIQQRLTTMLSNFDIHSTMDHKRGPQGITAEHRDLLFEAQKLKDDLNMAEERCKELNRSLKHWENEHRLAINRARTAEEDLKKAVASTEEAQRLAALERKKVQKLQHKVDELLQLQQRKTATWQDNRVDLGKKSAKDAANSDILGLQRKNEKLSAQLKKKQDEYQTKSLALQSATKEINDLKEEAAQIKAKNSDLSREIDGLKHIQSEVKAESNAGYMHAQVELQRRTRQVETLMRRFETLNDKHKEMSAALLSEKEKNEQLSERVTKLTAYEPLGDAEIADRIRIRNLVDQAQERLAIAAGLSVAPGESPALTWRLALGPSVEDGARTQRAKELLSEEKVSPLDTAFISNEEALLLVCQSYSRFRTPGNDLHKLLDRERYLTSLDRYLKHIHSESAHAPLGAMVDYVCPPSAVST